MKSYEKTWTTGALFICTKCGQSISADSLSESGSVSENLKNYLKSEIKKSGLAENIRVMTSSCLNICEEQTQAVAYIPTEGQGQQNFILHPEKDKQELLDFLKKQI